MVSEPLQATERLHEDPLPPEAPLVLLHTGTGREDLPFLGGKGRGLFKLEAMGQRVPPWYAVTTAAFRHVLAETGLAERIAGRLARQGPFSREVLRAAAEEIQDWLRNLAIPAGLAREIAAAHEELGFGGDPVAVRSSAADEDGTGGSFAGVHDSFLAVRGARAVLEAIRDVWVSGYGERALSYRLAQGMPLARTEMAVIVQRMVPARVSGVLFTADPVTGDTQRIVISSLYGLGEGLVGLGLDADRYVLDKETLTLETTLADKRERVVPAAGELVREAVTPEEQGASSLAREQVLALARAGLAIERRLGKPQDVEFAVDSEGNVFFLQTRPMTGLAEDGPAAGNRIFWDHQNWAENYPGVTLPMTYSVTRHMEKVTFHCFGDMMRIPRKKIETFQAVHETSLGYIGGRFYTHGINRYRLNRMIPGISFRRQELLNLLVIRPEEVDRETPDPEPGTLRRYFVELPALARVFAGLGRDFLRVHGMVEDLLKAARHFQEKCAAMDFRSMQPHELIEVYTEVELKLISRWKAPLINVLCLRFLWVNLKRLCAVWCGDTAGSLPHQLLRGEEGSESARPVKMLLALAHQASRDPDLLALFRGATPEELARRVPADPRFAGFAHGVQEYLDLFYFKGPEEMKLEDVTYRDRPELLYQLIQGYLEQGEFEALDPEVAAERERQARREAEERAFGAIPRGLLPRRAFFHWLLKHVRALDRHREEFKFMRLQLMGLLRDLLRSLGERFAADGVLDQPRDIFYLTLGEVLDFVRGTAVTSDLRGLVAVRRREIDAYAAAQGEEKPDDQFETFGVPYHRNRFKARQKAKPPAPAANGRLRGTGCSQGRVTGRVRLLRSPEDAGRLSGEILAVERIHPGWLPLLPAVSGLLVERGEILSHSATVAREMGIPTIVGIPGLTSVLRDGQRVTMDGGEGTVLPLEDEVSPR
ncbi:MAG TPA: PEP/pyruvate-binding domain-containing protein [Thermoanaerobaculia bacterium]|jgi:pyruvate,water dikinase|nr:PEP/pyruvate-binding domain-containing protein [Thermoanaerobaculia bacterium]